VRPASGSPQPYESAKILPLDRMHWQRDALITATYLITNRGRILVWPISRTWGGTIDQREDKINAIRPDAYVHQGSELCSSRWSIVAAPSSICHTKFSLYRDQMKWRDARAPAASDPIYG